nr:anti-sigma factor [Chthoniobacterales bacterium]
SRARGHSQTSILIPWGIAAGLALCCGLLLLGRSRHVATIAQLEQRAAASENQLVALSAERDRSQLALRDKLEQISANQTEIARLESERDALTRQISDLKQNDDAVQVKNKLLVEKTDALEKKVVQLEQQRSLNDMRVALLSSKMQSAPRALATVVWDPDKQEGILRTADVPANSSDQDYQLWLVDPKYQQPVDAGVFSVPTGGTAKVVFRPKAPISTANAFAISLERKGGVPKAEGPIVLAGK